MWSRLYVVWLTLHCLVGFISLEDVTDGVAGTAPGVTLGISDEGDVTSPAGTNLEDALVVDVAGSTTAPYQEEEATSSPAEGDTVAAAGAGGVVASTLPAAAAAAAALDEGGTTQAAAAATTAAEAAQDAGPKCEEQQGDVPDIPGLPACNGGEGDTGAGEEQVTTAGEPPGGATTAGGEEAEGASTTAAAAAERTEEAEGDATTTGQQPVHSTVVESVTTVPSVEKVGTTLAAAAPETTEGVQEVTTEEEIVVDVTTEGKPTVTLRTWPADDPCSTFTLLTQEARYFTQTGAVISDHDLEAGWYGFNYPRWYGLKYSNQVAVITPTCVKEGLCSTNMPYHLQEELSPPEIGETVAAVICGPGTVAGETDCCLKPVDIEVKNCQTRLIYKLKPLDLEHAGICTQLPDETVPVEYMAIEPPPTTTSTTPPTTTTPKPTLPSIKTEQLGNVEGVVTIEFKYPKELEETNYLIETFDPKFKKVFTEALNNMTFDLTTMPVTTVALTTMEVPTEAPPRGGIIVIMSTPPAGALNATTKGADREVTTQEDRVEDTTVGPAPANVTAAGEGGETRDGISTVATDTSEATSLGDTEAEVTSQDSAVEVVTTREEAAREGAATTAGQPPPVASSVEATVVQEATTRSWEATPEKKEVATVEESPGEEATTAQPAVAATTTEQAVLISGPETEVALPGAAQATTASPAGDPSAPETTMAAEDGASNEVTTVASADPGGDAGRRRRRRDVEGEQQYSQDDVKYVADTPRSAEGRLQVAVLVEDQEKRRIPADQLMETIKALDESGELAKETNLTVVDYYKGLPKPIKVRPWDRHRGLLIALIVFISLCVLIILIGICCLLCRQRRGSWTREDDKVRMEAGHPKKRPMVVENPMSDNEIMRDEAPMMERDNPAMTSNGGGGHLSKKDDDNRWVVPIDQMPEPEMEDTKL